MKTKKAQGGNLIWVVIGTAIVILGGVVSVIFIGGFRNIAPARIGTTVCQGSLQVSDELTGSMSRYEHYKCGGNFWGGAACFFDAGGWFGTAGWGGLMYDTAAVPILNGIDETQKKSFRRMCKENVPATCTGDAKEVANCLYDRAVDTYYVLLGGRKDSSGDSQTLSNFNLYEIKTRIDGPGEVLLKGDCSHYIILNDFFTGEPNPYADEYKCSNNGLANHHICWEDTTDEYGNQRCKIKFEYVNRFTMALAMVEKCQNTTAGPESSDCKCFVKPQLGYSTSNGLPLGGAYTGLGGDDYTREYGQYFWAVFHDIGGEGTYYGDLFDKYAGCGAWFPNENGKMIDEATFDSLGGVTIYSPMIHVPFLKSETNYTLYTRIPSDSPYYEGNNFVEISTQSGES